MDLGEPRWEVTRDEPRPGREVPWTVGDAVAGIILLGVVNFVAGIAVGVMAHAGVLSMRAAFRLLAPVTLAMTVLVVWYFAIRKRQGAWSDLGLKRSRWWVDLPLALAAEGGVLLVIFVYATLLLNLTKLKLPRQPVVELFGRSGPGIVLAVIYIAVLAPIGEELFFRGFLYGALKKRWGVGVGMVASAAVFAVFHITPLLYLPMFVIGLALAGLYQYRGSLVPAIMLHALNNLLALVMLFGR